MITLKYFPENDCKSRILYLKFGNTQTTAFVMTLTYFLLRSHNDYSPITFQLSYQEERMGGKLQVHKVLWPTFATVRSCPQFFINPEIHMIVELYTINIINLYPCFSHLLSNVLKI